MNVRVLNPGATIGVLGGGQLGRYLVLVARQRGYHVQVLDPDKHAPAMQLATVPVVAAYDDPDALAQLGNSCDAVTIEFENVPAQSLQILSELTQIAPGPGSVEISQDRLREKRCAQDSGLDPVPFAAVHTVDDIESAVRLVGLPAILKTARLGYDGKGQSVCESVAAVNDAYQRLGRVSCVLERKIELKLELSVVLARGFDGKVAVYPVARNTHDNGILFCSAIPAGIDDSLRIKAIEQSRVLAEAIDHVGVLAVEFFVDRQDNLYFNEMAPRPHNSGHYTIDATVSSQFEQQLRALCAQPLSSTELLSPVVMFNLLGDLWSDSAAPDFSKLLAESGCQLHLYGKGQARPGRKMGHVNCLAPSVEQASQLAHEQFLQLKQQAAL